MFASIRSYNGAGDVAAIRRGARKDLYPLLRKQPGFVSYSLIDAGGGSLTSISIFNTRKQADTANIAVRELVQRVFKDLLPNPPAIVVGEVVGHLDK
jgi:hypothetical protein